jgi:hypothetical protein
VHGTRHSAGGASHAPNDWAHIDWAHMFVVPSLREAIIKLIVLYVLMVIFALVLTFVFKWDRPSVTSTVAFWIIALASALLIFSR